MSIEMGTGLERDRTRGIVSYPYKGIWPTSQPRLGIQSIFLSWTSRWGRYMYIHTGDTVPLKHIYAIRYDRYSPENFSSLVTTDRPVIHIQPALAHDGLRAATAPTGPQTARA